MLRWEDFSDEPKPPPLHDRGMISLVVLSNSYVELTLDILRARLDEIFPGHFLPARDEGSFVIEGSVPETEFFIKSVVPGANGMFMLWSVPGPYTCFSDFAEEINDPVLRQLAEEQEYWMSVDLVHDGTTEAEAYRFIGSVLAALAPPDSAVLVHAGKLESIRFNDEVRRRLASGDGAFGTA
jgi:hypothetical protein